MAVTVILIYAVFGLDFEEGHPVAKVSAVVLFFGSG